MMAMTPPMLDMDVDDNNSSSTSATGACNNTHPPQHATTPQLLNPCDFVDVLPEELVIRIFDFTDLHSLSYTIPLICRRWKELSETNVLWRHLYRHRWFPSYPRRLRSSSSSSLSSSSSSLSSSSSSLDLTATASSSASNTTADDEDNWWEGDYTQADSLGQRHSRPPVAGLTWRDCFMLRSLIEAEKWPHDTSSTSTMAPSASAAAVHRDGVIAMMLTAKDFRRRGDRLIAIASTTPTTPLSSSPSSSSAATSCGLEKTTVDAVHHVINRRVSSSQQQLMSVQDLLYAMAFEEYNSAHWADSSDSLILTKWAQGLANQAIQKMETCNTVTTTSANTTATSCSIGIGNGVGAAETLFRASYDKFKRSTAGRELMLMWALTLYNHANMYIDDNFQLSEQLLLESVDRYNESETFGDSSGGSSQGSNGIADTYECLSQLKSNADEIDYWFTLAVERYSRAVQQDPSNGAILNNWGLAHHNHAFTKTGEQAMRLLEIAVDKYSQALTLDSEKYVILYNRGDALSQMAHLTTDPVRSDELFKQAGEEYQKSYALRNTYYFTPNNYGWSLYEQAARKTGKEFDVLLDRAMAQFDRALEIKPNYHVSIANRGNVFLERACRYGRQEDFDKAVENYQLAMKIRPRFYKANHYIGLHAMELARRLPHSNPQRSVWLEEALKSCQESIAIKPNYHSCAFTAAQVCALQGDWSGCEKWVAKYNSITGGLRDKALGAVPLSVQLFQHHADDLRFNFKTFPWRFSSFTTNPAATM